MATATERTLLSLDRWAQLIGVNPLHFNQVTTTKMPNTSCAKVWKQFNWQHADAVGREDLAYAIKAAENKIAKQLGYWPLPRWEVNESIWTIHPGDPTLFNVGARDILGFRQSLKLQWAQFISGGIEAKTIDSLGVAVVYTDVDGDGYKETATITFATSITDVCELAVYYPGEGGSDAWEIRPLQSVVIAGGNATIKFTRQQAVKPELLTKFEPQAVDGQDDNNFLATVDVYRHWNDPSVQAQLEWMPVPVNSPLGVLVTPACSSCGNSGCQACAFGYQAGCLLAQKYDRSWVQYSPGTWNSTTLQFDSAAYSFCRAPDRLTASYYAGYRAKTKACPTLQMDSDFEKAIAYLALTLLDRPLCGCNNLKAISQKWNEELNANISQPAASTSYQLSRGKLENPFGMTRGALYAWEVVNQQGAAMGRAVSY